MERTRSRRSSGATAHAREARPAPAARPNSSGRAKRADRGGQVGVGPAVAADRAPDAREHVARSRRGRASRGARAASRTRGRRGGRPAAGRGGSRAGPAAGSPTLRMPKATSAPSKRAVAPSGRRSASPRQRGARARPSRARASLRAARTSIDAREVQADAPASARRVRSASISRSAVPVHRSSTRAARGQVQHVHGARGASARRCRPRAGGSGGRSAARCGRTSTARPPSRARPGVGTRRPSERPRRQMLRAACQRRASMASCHAAAAPSIVDDQVADADPAVHGEERGVDAREVVRATPASARRRAARPPPPRPAR